MKDARQTLEYLIKQRGENYASISRLLGRNAAYIQQFIKRGIPDKLDEDDRRQLARYFDVCETTLGARNHDTAMSPEAVKIPVLQSEHEIIDGTPDRFSIADFVMFDENWLGALTEAKAESLCMVYARDDAMAPELQKGDSLLADMADRNMRETDGVYIVSLAKQLVARRVKPNEYGKVRIICSNPLRSSWHNRILESSAIVGRVIWVGHRL